METPQAIDQHTHWGEWVARDPKTDTVVAHSRTFDDAEQMAIEQGIEPVMEFVPESDGYFIGRA